jgi:ribonucleoside-diphosphate reductase alpha chain
VKDVFRTANEIPAEWHIRMQAAFQQHCDSAISKTTNFAHTATKEDVRTIYEMAYDLNCKGVTVYRDGSRDGQVLSTGATAGAAAERKGEGATVGEKADFMARLAEVEHENDRLKKVLFDAEAENLNRRQKRSRPDKLRGTTIRRETPLGVMFVNITEDEKGQPFEVFINLGKAGGSAMADAEALGRMVSLSLRSGIPLMEIHKQLRGISSDRAVGLGPNKVLSMPDAVGQALYEWWQDKQGVQTDLLSEPTAPQASTPVAPQVAVPVTVGAQQMMRSASDTGEFIGSCPDCSSQLEYAEGCVKCHVCGFSECG